MGLISESIKILYFSKEEIWGKNILSFGNPFFSKKRLKELNFDKQLIEEIFRIERNKRAEYFFKKVFNARLHILDISDTEGGNLIFDLNEKISETTLKGKFDLIIDPGTAEHIFNTKLFLENVFFLLKKGGIYFFQLPLNGWIDHGFRQYSPTFFNDLCFGNKDTLSLINLFVYHRGRKKLINLLYFYQSRELEHKILKSKLNANLNSINLKNYTNTYLYLLSKKGGYLDNIGMIRKLENNDLNFSITQQIYRISSLDQILPNNKKDILLKIKVLRLLKKIFILFPLPCYFKLWVLELFFGK
tara:strand:- start:773 stop:1678 length:906 start_codon:yes stop_codon:yes gene_type:complete